MHESPLLIRSIRGFWGRGRGIVTALALLNRCRASRDNRWPHAGYAARRSAALQSDRRSDTVHVPPPNIKMGIGLHDREGLGIVGQAKAFVLDFQNEADRTGRIVERDMVRNRFQIALGFGGQLDLHSALSDRARYLLSSRSKTEAASLVRPASTSATPRMIDASSAASRVSRS
eukprot:TRINITY_DN34194_c0_g1_i9.p1 TRINITY_DN34194_c0_g1~~TRINITY_DN34194_c0_g1_i9.p1  ORF type:complete len:174 (+),score=7.52 TRINITY_DN34194_c0_g1_i9:168-689(+)